MTDLGFPIIEYSASDSPQEWGRQHGETHRTGIVELIAIRTQLMREKNPRLDNENIRRLAQQQWNLTAAYDSSLTAELSGIAEGAGVSLEEIVVLNNYTDFRDIEVLDQGCSAIYVQRNNNIIAGQTWDMHRSAKNYVCCLKIPATNGQPESIAFSIVGCLGMTGYTSRGSMVGVNNLNTSGARPGVLWAAVIRRMLSAKNLEHQRHELQAASLTSGRSFLLADRRNGGEFWEAMPDLHERVSALATGEDGHLFHTNHCLGEQARQRENRGAMSSTTHTRFELIERKISSVQDWQSGWDLLNDHEGYPRSICSNFQTNAQDPSVTCGGAIGDLKTGLVRMWRGDHVYDDSFVQHEFQLPMDENE